jgi:hypothetical protein
MSELIKTTKLRVKQVLAISWKGSGSKLPPYTEKII